MTALIDTFLMAAYLAFWGWIMARSGMGEAIFAISFIGLASISQALEGGFYWSVFPRGHGFFTANRTSALAVYLACLYGPLLIAHLHWRFIGHKRWRDEVLRKFGGDAAK